MKMITGRFSLMYYEILKHFLTLQKMEWKHLCPTKIGLNMSQFCKNYKRPLSQFTVGNKNFGNKDWKNYFLSFPDLKIDFHGLKKKKKSKSYFHLLWFYFNSSFTIFKWLSLTFFITFISKLFLNPYVTSAFS